MPTGIILDELKKYINLECKINRSNGVSIHKVPVSPVLRIYGIKSGTKIFYL